jgi:ribonuclease VapC
MVIDTSALLAILLGEPEADAVAAAIERNVPRLLSAANLLEASIVIEARKGEAGGRELDLLLYRGEIESLRPTVTRSRPRGRLGESSARAGIQRH